MRISLLLLLLAISNSALGASDALPKKLHLASTQWCPYVCSGPHSGGVSQYIAEILAQHDVALNVTQMPWSRAVKQAKEGVYDGLLTVGETEARALSYTNTPIGYYQTCFLSLKSSDVTLSEPFALNGARLGIVQGYGYGWELDQFIEKSADGLVAISGFKVFSRLVRLLSKKRVDMIAVDTRELRWWLGADVMEKKNLKSLGCLTAAPYFMGLNRAFIGRGDIISLLDVELSKPYNQRRLERLLSETYRLSE